MVREVGPGSEDGAYWDLCVDHCPAIGIPLHGVSSAGTSQ